MPYPELMIRPMREELTRLGIEEARRHAARPDRAITVFAGADTAATERARGYFSGYPPSSPSVALLKDGRLVYMLQRSDIETRDAPAIARELTRAFDQHCTKAMMN